MVVKICSKCRQELLHTQFSKNKRTADGFSHYCKTCATQAYNAWKKQNKEAAAEATKRWRATNPEAARLSARKSDKKRAQHPTRKECTAKAIAVWRKANKSLVNSYTAERRAKRLQATQTWANDAIMDSYYAMAQWLTAVVPGHAYEVDHIVPLQSDIVCGLHTHSNLQVLEASVNRAKGNRYWPDMP